MTKTTPQAQQVRARWAAATSASASGKLESGAVDGLRRFCGLHAGVPGPGSLLSG
ncbi:hypothetical protein LNP74_29610 [Klebsiella pneumoniae subsp. pneumoniae]|nr:hypothetical protein [Klebsiella pneumoniae subsp. pneumoniae]